MHVCRQHTVEAPADVHPQSQNQETILAIDLISCVKNVAVSQWTLMLLLTNCEGAQALI